MVERFEHTFALQSKTKAKDPTKTVIKRDFVFQFPPWQEPLLAGRIIAPPKTPSHPLGRSAQGLLGNQGLWT
jgi:hypothetical protein